MNKAVRYLRMKTPADLLTVNFFATSGQLKGQFVQECEPPWTIWWEVAGDLGFIGRLGSMIQGQIEAPEKVWDEGTPQSALKQMSWLDLFRKAVIKPEETRKVADDVILMTADREIFFTTVKKHFMLQQGQFEFAIFDARREYFLLKISKPSLWVFNTLKPSGFTWFNQIEGHSGVYVEAGWRIHDISGPECFNQFKIMDSGVLLVQKDGRLLNLKPAWKKGESIIKVDFGQVQILQKDQSEGLVIKPGLRKIEHQQLAVFWKVDDRSKLRAIISNESLKSFHNYRCWACSDGRVYLLAIGDQADRGLASILTDAFTPFGQVEDRVMVPTGYLLTPKLSSERLHKLLDAHIADYICFEMAEGQIVTTLLENDSLLRVEDFITLEVERAIDKATLQKPGWQFEFKELKKKKQLIRFEASTPLHKKLEPVSEEGQVGSFRTTAAGNAKKRNTSLNFDFGPEIGDSETEQLRLQINTIDNQLNSNAANAELWRQRSDVTRRMRMKYSSLAAGLNAAVLNGDTPTMVDCALEFCRTNPDLSLMLSEQVTELEKGRLLAAIRSEQINAEFHYVLLLLYAGKFGDRDIFNQGVAGMKTGFAVDKRQFYGFSESRVASSGGMNLENRVELLTAKDFPRIAMNVKKFLLHMGCCSSLVAISIAKLQLKLILQVNLDKRSADQLIGAISNPAKSSVGNYPWASAVNSSSSNTGFTDFFFQIIGNWPESSTTKVTHPSVARWLKLVTMEKIKETPLRDFFTGDLYKPPFMFSRDEESQLKGGIVKASGWLEELSLTEFPETSDGKSIARAIYSRFSNGKPDWADLFKRALANNDMVLLAKAQRLLLLMVSEYGPHPDFEAFIAPATVELDQRHGWDIYSLTVYCDMFRLSLAYRKPVDEQRLFNLLINRIPQPPGGWADFRDSAEWIILCLLLTSSPVRRFQLDNFLGRAMRWLQEGLKSYDEEIFAETLTILCFLSIGTLADLVPETLEFHQLLEKRRVFWIQHAFAQYSRSEDAFKEWFNACHV